MFSGWGEFLLESAEAGKGFGTEFGYGGQHAAYRFFLHIARLGEEFISVADESLKAGLRHKAAVERQREAVGHDILAGETGAGVAFGHAGKFLGASFEAEQVGAEQAVAQVMVCAVAIYAGGVAETDADVVEHSGGFNIPFVERLGNVLPGRGGEVIAGKCGDCGQAAGAGDAQGFVGYLTAMPHINIPKASALGIIFVDNLLIVVHFAIAAA